MNRTIIALVHNVTNQKGIDNFNMLILQEKPVECVTWNAYELQGEH